MERKFVFGTAVTDYNFTGRSKETERLKTAFRSGINVILMSARRLGKTSLVKHVCQQLKSEEIITVYLDIFSCKSEYDFYNKLATEVLKQTASRKELWLDEAKDFMLRLAPKISLSPNPTAEFSIALGITPKTHSPEEVLSLAENIAVRKQKRIVVCIDEFQQIGEMDNSAQVQARLRAIWQHQKHVSYCLFGSKRHLMSSIFLHRSMPFYQFGDLIALEKISTKEWVEYIVSHFADGNKIITNEQAESICTFVDNYSSYVQQLAWILYTQTKEGEGVTEESVNIAKQDLLNVNEILFMQMVEPLSEYQFNFLRAVVNGVHSDFGLAEIRETYKLGSYSNIARLKKALLERDIITSENKMITLTDPVFEQWFKRKMM